MELLGPAASSYGSDKKVMVDRKGNVREAYSSGFGVRTKFVNKALGFASKCEVVPQRITGTSLMAILKSEGHDR